MGFFTTTDGKDIQSEKQYEQPSGEIKPIPSGAQLVALIEEIGISETDRIGRFISIKWNVVNGEYKGRKIFQKVKVFGDLGAPEDKESKVIDKAKAMLAAIDANAGGKLFEKNEEPTDITLMKHLANKIMTITVRIWEMEVEGEKKSGNWVSAVAPKAAQGAKKNAEVEEDLPF